MAITKILAKNNRLDVLIRYVTNQDKTEEQVLTAYLNCDPGHAYQQMMDTKRAVGKTDGRQAYHIIQPLRPERSRRSWPLSWPRRSPVSTWPGIKW